MVDVQREIELHVPRADVAAYASNPENAPQWYQNIHSVRWLSESPLQVGSLLAFSARFLGRNLEYTYEIVDLVPSEMLVMRTKQGPFPMQTTYTWSDSGSGTLMTLRNNGEPKGFSVIASVLMAPMIRRAMSKDLAKLKQIVEAAQGGPEPLW